MWWSKATKSITVARKPRWGGEKVGAGGLFKGTHTPQWHAFSSSWSFSLPEIVLPSGDKTPSMCTGGGHLIPDHNNVHVTFGFPSVGGQTAKLLSEICRSGGHWCPRVCSGHCSHRCSAPSWPLLLFQSWETQWPWALCIHAPDLLCALASASSRWSAIDISASVDNGDSGV